MANGNGAAWDVFWKTVSIVCIPWAAWVSYTMIEVRERLAVIESHQISDTAVADMITSISTRVDDKADADEVPPQWFQNKVDDIARRVTRLEEKSHGEKNH